MEEESERRPIIEVSNTGETYVVKSTGEKIIPSSVRPDGSVRKSLRVRAGYTPLEEQTKYKSRGTLIKEQIGPISDLPVGLELLNRPVNSTGLPVGLSPEDRATQPGSSKKKSKKNKKAKEIKFEIEEPTFD